MARNEPICTTWGLFWESSSGYAFIMELAKIKSGTVNEERHFIKTGTEHFTPYFHPLIPWVNRLGRRVFPNGKTREKEDQELYSLMRRGLRKAMEDSDVLPEWAG